MQQCLWNNSANADGIEFLLAIIAGAIIIIMHRDNLKKACTKKM